jgi:hypothetical protein
MRFMLMMNAPRGTGNYAVSSWPAADLQAHIAFMQTLNRELSAAGELVTAEGLAMPGEAKLVHAGADGTPITDGPFPESKEFLAGFWIVEVESAERAYEIAARVSTAPGLGGRPMIIPVEVRQVMSAPKIEA